ncbi:MAG TPA: glycosyltransferase family 4 protein, partial [Desulfohalobiaceae bacterium]|nr:glycosyltransferase family 4 protein [Desulfohalobiaceae bacterium]
HGVQKIRTIIKTEAPHIIHCHMKNAHLLAGLAQKRDNLAPLIRTIYNPEQLGRDLRTRLCNKYFSHGLIVMTEQTKQSAVKHFFSQERIKVIEPGIDVKRFSPKRSLNQKPDSIGCLDKFFVIGMVTRIRKTRRLDISLQVLHQLHQQYPQLRLLLVGRGRPGAYESVVEKPVSELGIKDLVIPTGYCQGDELVEAFRKMDVLIYTMPGTDKTCRTVREAMSAGVPVIAPRIGFLPQLIQDRVSGRLVNLTPNSFSSALKELLDAPNYLKELSQGALESAQKKFDLSVQAEETLQFYERIMEI